MGQCYTVQLHGAAIWDNKHAIRDMIRTCTCIWAIAMLYGAAAMTYRTVAMLYGAAAMTYRTVAMLHVYGAAAMAYRRAAMLYGAAAMTYRTAAILYRTGPPPDQ